jgi:hypothetical protein
LIDSNPEPAAQMTHATSAEEAKKRQMEASANITPKGVGDRE